MAIVIVVGNDESVVREGVIGQVRSELGKRNQILGLGAVSAHVGKIRQGVMVFGVAASVTAGVSDRGEVFGILLPGFPGADQMPNDFVGLDVPRKAFVSGVELTGGRHTSLSEGWI